MNASQATLLVELFNELVAATPKGSVPYVTLTNDPERPLGAVILGACGHVVCQARGKTVAGLVNLIGMRLGTEPAEVRQ